MLEIARDTAVEFLKRDLLRHVCIPLNEDFEDGSSPVIVLADSAQPTAILVAPTSAGNYNVVTMAGYSDTFTADAAEWLAKTFDQFRLISHDGRVFDTPAVRERFEFGTIGKSTSWACDSLDRVPTVTNDRVCLLTMADRPAALQYPRIRAEGVPGPNLPEMLETHEVYGAKQDGEILGFISAARDYHEIWDVDIIHVREEHRRQGLASALAATYARTMLSTGRIPYYSGASEVSGKAAQRAGFFVCRELFWADMKSRG